MVQPTGDHKIKLFSLNSNRDIAEKIAAAAGLPLGKLSSRQFSDGEIQINQMRLKTSGRKLPF